MANRHLSRSLVLQTLFEWDFNEYDKAQAVELLDRNIEEFAPGSDEDSFTKNLLNLVLAKRVVIDEIVEKAAPDWPIDKISVVDRNILRIGLSELLFGDRKEVPPKVAINESIELAKSFGGEKSSKFVNGVMGAVYKEIGEPGKDDTAPKKEKKEEIDFDSLPIETKAGAVVYKKVGDEIFLGMVHDVFGYWTLSKEGVRDGRTVEETAAHAIKEEMGVDIEIQELLGENEYLANHPEKGKIRKQVKYFLGFAPGDQEVSLTSDSGGLDGAQWFSLPEVLGLTIYDDILPLITKSIQIITK